MIKSHSVKMFVARGLQSGNSFNKLYTDVFNSDFEKDIGFGFKDVLRSENWFSATLLVCQETNIPQLDVETGEYVEQIVSVYKEVDFLIHQEFSMVFIFGTNQDAKELIDTFAYKLALDNSFSPIKLTPTSVVNSFFDAGKVVSVERITIKNFQYREGIVGRYTLKADLLDDVRRLLDAYKGDVSQVRFTITTDEFDIVDLTVSINGAITVRCTPEDKNDVIFSLIPMIVKKSAG